MPKRYATAHSPAVAQPVCRAGVPRVGFTLVELLIVIGIIAVLVAILIPTVAGVRQAAQGADTASMIRAIDAACRKYQIDLGDYPGVFPESMLGPGNAPANPDGSAVSVEPTSSQFIADPDELENVTGTENMLLSLLGGMVPTSDGSDIRIIYDPAAVGRGPVSLRRGKVETYDAFYDARDEDHSMHAAGSDDENVAGLNSADVGKQWGKWVEVYGTAQDSLVPEFVDRYSDPMPILYMRANPNTQRVGSANYAIAARAATNGRAVYNLDQIAGYVTQNTISTASGDTFDYIVGTGRDPRNAMHSSLSTYHGLQVGYDTDQENGFNALEGSHTYMSQNINMADGPFDAVPYLSNPASQGGAQPYKPDSFVLISAGPDRVYGTKDDITNFGN